MKKTVIKGMLALITATLIIGCSEDSTTTIPTTTANKFSGGLVWDYYVNTNAGGSGTLPTGATNKDFVRCKACHGWDTMGKDGGYVRRSASTSRPNPTATTGNISAKAGSVTADMVWHNGNNTTTVAGRAFSTEDQTMPNFSNDGGLTSTQVDNVVAFLNSGEKLTTFADLDIAPNPVGYSFKSVDAAAGKTTYETNCLSCHGSDGDSANATGDGVGVVNTALSGELKLADYFSSDGKYSEGFHKIMYGVSGSDVMTRDASGNLTGQETANVLAYIQDTFAADYYAGGLVWDYYVNTNAGGSGSLPSGATNKDFLRCKACHGWDGMGADGGYVRRSANATRPNPTATTGNLSTKMGSVVAADVLHDGTQVSTTVGRAFSTEDQTMPNFGATGGLTSKQVLDVVQFINKGPKITDHATLDITANPVTYTFSGTNTTTGSSLYASKCAECHGSDGDSANGDGTVLTALGVELKLGNYFSSDGKYSEGFHKMIYGVSGSDVMTREGSGNLTSQQAADILAYIQEQIADGNATTFPQ